jgi:hypothetical protein
MTTIKLDSTPEVEIERANVKTFEFNFTMPAPTRQNPQEMISFFNPVDVTADSKLIGAADIEYFPVKNQETGCVEYFWRVFVFLQYESSERFDIEMAVAENRIDNFKVKVCFQEADFGLYVSYLEFNLKNNL